MDETPRAPVTFWQLLRRHFVRIVIGVVLAVAVYGLLPVWMPYQREQRIAKEIQSPSILWIMSVHSFFTDCST